MIRLSASGNKCAWCLADAGIKANPKDSHGICKEHVDKIRADLAKRKAAHATTAPR